MISSINMSNIKLTIKFDFYLKIFISNASTRNWTENILIFILSLKELTFRRINYNFLHSWKYILYSTYLSWNDSLNQTFSIVFNHHLCLLSSRIKSNMKWKISSISRFYTNIYSISSNEKIIQFQTILRNLSIIFLTPKN